MEIRTAWEVNTPTTIRKVSSDKKNRKVLRQPRLRIKNPAVAFSLSLLIWGSGQFYNRQYKLGSFFLLCMLTFYSLGTYLLLDWEFISGFMRSTHISIFQTFLVCALLYISGVIVWLINADQAYRKAARTRSKPYLGIENHFIPPLCSLMIPGWGQILNGQTSKAGCFLMSAMAGLFAVPAVFMIPAIWPSLETSSQRIILEIVLAVALLLCTVFPLAWLFSIFDALRVSLEDVKKEPVRKRFQYALNRIRMYGFIRGVLPQIKLTLVLSLLLTLVFSGSLLFFPRDYYAHSLKNLQVRLAQKEMVFIPKLIGKVLDETPSDLP
jgi:hypothetical protein